MPIISITPATTPLPLFRRHAIDDIFRHYFHAAFAISILPLLIRIYLRHAAADAILPSLLPCHAIIFADAIAFTPALTPLRRH
jgi:hypothetical protein